MDLHNDTIGNFSITRHVDQIIGERKNKSLFDLDFSLATLYITLVIIISVIGLTGNIFIIFVMKKEKNMNKDARIFIINMAVADLCVSGIADPMCIVGKSALFYCMVQTFGVFLIIHQSESSRIILVNGAILGLDSLRGAFWICVFLASMCLTVCTCVTLNVVCLTVNRWICICHDSVYDSIFTRKLTVTYCISTWVIGFFVELPNFFGVGGHTFDEKTFQCTWDRTTNKTYTMFMGFVVITLPLLVLAYCNVAMVRKIWSVKKNLSRFSSNARSTLKTSMESAKILLTMFLVFVVCWTPFTVVILTDTQNELSFEVSLFTLLLVHSHSCSSCLIYLSFKKNFRRYLRGLFQRNRIQPSSTNVPKSNNNIVMREIA